MRGEKSNKNQNLVKQCVILFKMSEYMCMYYIHYAIFTVRKNWKCYVAFQMLHRIVVKSYVH